MVVGKGGLGVRSSSSSGTTSLLPSPPQVMGLQFGIEGASGCAVGVRELSSGQLFLFLSMLSPKQSGWRPNRTTCRPSLGPKIFWLVTGWGWRDKRVTTRPAPLPPRICLT